MKTFIQTYNQIVAKVSFISKQLKLKISKSTGRKLAIVPEKIIAYKNKIYPELLLLTDIQVKYKSMIKPRPLVKSAALVIQHGADGLIITGEATGIETPIEKITEVRGKFPNFPIFVGAGVNEKNIQKQFSIANGAIVGTSIKKGEKIDLRKATRVRKQI